MDWIIPLLGGLAAGLAAGFVLGRLQYQRFLTSQGRDAKTQSEQILTTARGEAERIVKDAEIKARDETVTRREEFDREAEKARTEIREMERRVSKREETLERRDEEISRRDKHLADLERKLAKRQQSLTQRSADLDAREEEIGEKLRDVAGLTREEAEALYMERLESELAVESDQLLRRRMEDTQEKAEEQARKLILATIQRGGTAYMSEAVVSTVDVPNDEMKGRVIGREGRNIRAFEKLTGVDVIVDDTPGVITLSSFDKFRREIARRTMVQLIQDGRVHPSRIEEVTAKVKREMDQYVREQGKKALAEVGLHGMHGKLTDLLGRLRFRTSYGQNVLDHTVEAALIAGTIAAEMKMDIKLAKRCTMLHDVGKAIDHQVEGGHPAIGADLARRCGENKVVVNAIAAHHDDVPMESPYAVITQVADALSAGRPGARMEAHDRYIDRLQRLEDVALAFPGVEQVYAVQAGREVRVIVNNAKMSDKLAMKVARDIAKDIEQELTYPGEVRVTVVRETRVVEYAR
jgi:ribonuclease Y